MGMKLTKEQTAQVEAGAYEAAEGIATIYCDEEDTFAPEVRRIAQGIVALVKIPEEVVDEVQRRMDAVVDAAVAWSTAEDDEVDYVEILTEKVDALLQLRSSPQGASQPIVPAIAGATCSECGGTVHHTVTCSHHFVTDTSLLRPVVADANECSNPHCLDGWVDKESGNQEGTESYVSQVPCQVCGVHVDLATADAGSGCRFCDHDSAFLPATIEYGLMVHRGRSNEAEFCTADKGAPTERAHPDPKKVEAGRLGGLVRQQKLRDGGAGEDEKL